MLPCVAQEYVEIMQAKIGEISKTNMAFRNSWILSPKNFEQNTDGVQIKKSKLNTKIRRHTYHPTV